MASTSEDIERLDAEVTAIRSELGETLGALVAKADVPSRAKAKAVEVKDSAVRAVNGRPAALAAAVGAMIGLLAAAGIAAVLIRRRF